MKSHEDLDKVLETMGQEELSKGPSMGNLDAWTDFYAGRPGQRRVIRQNDPNMDLDYIFTYIPDGNPCVRVFIYGSGKLGDPYAYVAGVRTFIEAAKNLRRGDVATISIMGLKSRDIAVARVVDEADLEDSVDAARKAFESGLGNARFMDYHELNWGITIHPEDNYLID